MKTRMDSRDEIVGPMAEEILKMGRQVCVRAGGASMSPFIQHGDIVVLAPLERGPRVGDVVLVKTAQRDLRPSPPTNDLWLLHRVVRRSADSVVTRGDACRDDDDDTPDNQVIGRVTRVSGKGWNFHLKYPFGYLIARRVIFSPRLREHPWAMMIGRLVAGMLG